MNTQASTSHDDFDDPMARVEDAQERSVEHLCFRPGTIEDEPDDLPTGPRAQPCETAVLDDWRKAEADHAAPACAFTFRAWPVSGSTETGWKRQSRLRGSRPVREEGQSLRHWPWAGQGVFVPLADPLTV